MGKLYSNGGYEVTVNDDRTIRVNPGDWLSKYSMAIYNDFKHIDKFKEKTGEDPTGKILFKDFDDPNLIEVGQDVYHPDPLPHEPTPPPVPSIPGTEPPIQSRYVAEFLKWTKEHFQPCRWTAKATVGLDLSLFFWTGQYLKVDVTHKRSSVVTRFHALGEGLTIGWPDSIAGGSFSAPVFFSTGTVLRSPFRSELRLDDFRHGTFLMEFGAAYFDPRVAVPLGGSITFLYFGIGFPPTRVLSEVNRFLRYGDYGALGSLIVKAAPSGVAILAGQNVGIPGVAVAARAGMMYDRGYWGV